MTALATVAFALTASAASARTVRVVSQTKSGPNIYSTILSAGTTPANLEHGWSCKLEHTPNPGPESIEYVFALSAESQLRPQGTAGGTAGAADDARTVQGGAAQRAVPVSTA